MSEDDEYRGDTPPQDVPAERAVLGAMMLSKDAIEAVVTTVFAADYYQPAYEVIYGVIVDLYTRGQAADVITVSDELSRTEMLRRVGGEAYLHEAPSPARRPRAAGTTPSGSATSAIMRRLVEAGPGSCRSAMAGAAASLATRSTPRRLRCSDAIPLTAAKDYAPDVSPGRDHGGSRGRGSMGASTILGVPTGFTRPRRAAPRARRAGRWSLAARPAMGSRPSRSTSARAASHRARADAPRASRWR